jgi:hypothetical protein
MNVRDAIANRLRKLVDALAEGRVEPWMILEARACAPSLRHRPSIRKAPIPSVVFTEARQAAEAAAETAETSRIRVACLTRAAGRCELCGRPLVAGEEEMAHLDGGSGKRRQMQRVSNCLIAHHVCHQGPCGLDRKPLAWLPAVKAWAARHGYPVPDRFQKLEALRAPEVAR